MLNKYLVQTIAVIAVVCAIHSIELYGQLLSDEEAQDTLRLIAAQIRQNQERVQTWVGIAEIKENLVYGSDKIQALSKISPTFKSIAPNISSDQGVKRTGSGIVSFATDIRQDKMYSKLQIFKPETTNSITGKEYDNAYNEFDQASIITPETYMHFQPNMWYGRSQVPVTDGERKRAAFIDPVENIRERLCSDVVDPRQFGCVMGEPACQLLDRIVDWMAKGENTINGQEVKVSVERESEGVYRLIYSGSNEGGAKITGEYVFDEKVGLNIVSNTVKWGDKQWVRIQSNWEYTKNNGVYVPSKVTRVNYDEQGNVKFSRDFSIKDSKINVPVGNHTFTLEQLGVEDGDRVINNIENIEYTYNNGKLVPATGKLMMEEMEDMLDKTIEDIPTYPAKSSIREGSGDEEIVTSRQYGRQEGPSNTNMSMQNKYFVGGWILLAVGGWILLAMINAVVALRKRRSWLGWLLVSFFFGPLATLILLASRAEQTCKNN